MNEANNADHPDPAHQDARSTDRIDEVERRRPAGDRRTGCTQELTAVEEDVYQVRNQSNQDPLNFPIKTNNRLASLLRVVETGDGRPTGNVEPIFNDLQAELKAQTDRLQQTLTTDLPAFNRLAQRMGLEPVKEKQ